MASEGEQEGRGKRVVVLGGSGTVGGAVVRTLHAAGARVAFSYFRGERAARELEASTPGTAALACDLSSTGGPGALVDAAAAHLGGLDALVHCAGIGVTRRGGEGTYELMHEIDAAAWDSLFAVNVRSAFLATQRLIAHLPSGGGSVVLVGSVDSVKAVPSPVHYAAARGAQSAMVRAIAKEHGRRGLRANVVAPGLLAGGASRAVPAEVLREYVKHTALRRVGTIDELAAVVAFLALEDTYATGQTLCLDGGL